MRARRFVSPRRRRSAAVGTSRAAYSCRPISPAMRSIRLVPVARALHALEALGHALAARRAFGQAIEADEDAAPAEGDEPDALRLPRPPADGVAGRDVEVHAP